jgi:uncharacterized membrane protein
MPVPLLSPLHRRVLQAVLYETIAVAFVVPALWWLFGQSPLSTLALTLTMAGIALAWNYGFNAVFERWEARQGVPARTWGRRLLHGASFELGLALVLVPVMAWWLNISLLEALLADIGVLLFFMVYTMAFTWGFDQVFGLPASASRAAD